MMRLAPGMYKQQGKHYIVEDELASSLGMTQAELADTRLDLLISIAATERGLDPSTFERVRTMPDWLKGR